MKNRKKYLLPIVPALSLAVITLFFAMLFSETPDLPKPQGRVADFAGALTPQVKQQMNALLLELEQKTSAEVAVVTVKNMEGGSIEDFAVRLFGKWGIGKKGKDNGVLFLVSVEDRKTRIETGYGMEGILPDAKTGGILDTYVLPYFKQGDYNQGILNGTSAIALVIAKDAGVELTGGIAVQPVAKKRSTFRAILNLVILIILIPIFIRNPFLLLLFLGGRRGGGGGFSGGFGGGGFGGGMSGGGGSSRSW